MPRGQVEIHTEDATITTASIEIKTIRVNRKQMTQSVFRQLPEKGMVDKSKAELLGVPWGYVNYHWGEIPPRKTHFLFQSGTSLYRSPFHVMDSSAWGCTLHEDEIPYVFDEMREEGEFFIDLFHLSRVLSGWRPDGVNDHPGDYMAWKGCYSEGELHIYKYIPKVEPAFSEAPSNVHFFRLCGPLRYQDPGQKPACTTEGTYREMGEKEHEFRLAARECAERYIEKRLGSLLSTEQIAEEIRLVKGKAVAFRQKWDAMMERLRQVEQLYIAV